MLALLAIFLSALCLALWIRHIRQRDTSTLGDTQPEQQREPTPQAPATQSKDEANSSSAAAVTPSRPLVQAKPLLPEQFVIFDLETTGLSPHSHEIIEFGAIRVTIGQSEHDTFQMLSRPSRKLPRKIVELTGITQEEMDRDGKDPEQAFHAFLEFIGDLPLVAFNADFDMGFLNATSHRYGTTISNCYTCALKRARRAWPELESHRLAFIAATFNLPSHNQHRALGDCERTFYVFWLATKEIGTKVRWLKPKAFQPERGLIYATDASSMNVHS